MAFTEQYDIAVVGAGHAGCEAAMAAARMGLKTALITMNLDLIAQMSCNPAIGGVARGTWCERWMRWAASWERSRTRLESSSGC